MKKVILAETLFLKKKRQKVLEKNLIAILLELIRVDKVMMQTMKQVEYKNLLVNLKKNKIK